MEENNKSHFGYYGSTRLLRVFCKNCKCFAFVIDKTFSCCDSPYEKVIDKKQRMISGSGIRKNPPRKVQIEILRGQQNKCFYCSKDFGSFYIRDGKSYQTFIHWDHYVPFNYLQDNPYGNWVAACNICNLIKHDKIFESAEDARNFINYRMQKKGIIFA